jgi:hypothetical protein
VTSTVVTRFGAARRRVGDQRGPAGRVQPRERLVEQQDFRLEHQRARQGHALRFTTRERPRLSRRERAHAEALEPRRHARRGDGGGDAAKAQAEPDVVSRRGVRQQRLLEHSGYPAPLGQRVASIHWPVVEPYGAGLRALQQPEHAQQRGLTTAVGAHERQQLAGRHVQRGDVQHEARRMHAAHVAQGEHRAHAGSTWIEPRWIENSQRRSRSISRIS